MATETPAPVVGQIWQDNDPRSPDRFLKVLSIDGAPFFTADCALVKQVTPQPGGGWAPTTKAPTRIRLDRFRPTRTGYRYVGEAQS